jgi:hypothetical protein
MGLDKREGLDVRCDGRERKITEKSKYFAAIREVAAGKLSQNEWVHEYLGIFQHARELRDAFSEMVYPNGSVNQDHARFGRRRGTERSLTSLPPSLASRRALSRAIKACRPACMSAVRPFTPVTR